MEDTNIEQPNTGILIFQLRLHFLCGGGGGPPAPGQIMFFVVCGGLWVFYF
jgi:hypothetical protein